VNFFVRRVLGGKDHRVTLGNHRQLSVREARILAMAKISELEFKVSTEQRTHAYRGVSSTSSMGARDPRIDEVLELLRERPSAKAKEGAPAPGLTLGELWDRVGPGWLGRVKPKTAENIKLVFRSRVLPKWAATPVSEIRNANLGAWYESFLGSAPHYGAVATKKVIQLLKLGHEQELIAPPPTFSIRFVASKRRKPLSRQAICKLVGALDELLMESPFHSQANAIISIMNTGERATAGLQLHTSQVDYENKCITKARKFDQVKTIPISDFAAGFLRSIHPKGGGYFFPNRRDPSKPIHYNALLAFLKKLCRMHGVQAVDGSTPTIHSMRHTYATLLEEKGLPISHIQRLLGHSCISSTLRYVHGNQAAAREGANLIEVTKVGVKR